VRPRVLPAFLPWTSDRPPAPELVPLVFLPALLYWASVTTSLREIRQNLRVAVLSAVALVSATAAAKADYEQHLHVPADPLMPADDPDAAAERGEHADDQRLHAALIEVKRAVVVRLRDARKIDEIVLRDLQTCLDAEEVGSSAPSPEPD
jgi:hypothetical protein